MMPRTHLLKIVGPLNTSSSAPGLFLDQSIVNVCNLP